MFATVSQVYNADNIKIPLTRIASLLLRAEKAKALAISFSYPFSDRSDNVIWGTGLFTVHFMCMWLNFRGENKFKVNLETKNSIKSFYAVSYEKQNFDWRYSDC
jgi:hypothetical protein